MSEIGALSCTIMGFSFFISSIFNGILGVVLLIAGIVEFTR
jgi:hypothetical protein